jgi:hypothetical protein
VGSGKELGDSSGSEGLRLVAEGCKSEADYESDDDEVFDAEDVEPDEKHLPFDDEEDEGDGEIET